MRKHLNSENPDTSSSNERHTLRNSLMMAVAGLVVSVAVYNVVTLEGERPTFREKDPQDQIIEPVSSTTTASSEDDIVNPCILVSPDGDGGIVSSDPTCGGAPTSSSVGEN